MVAAADTNAKIPRLAFSYAKTNQVFISEVTEASVELTYVGELSSALLSELRRYLARPIRFNQVDSDKFQVLMARAYEAGKDSAHEAIIGIEENMDLSQLQNIPVTQDLLAGEDDAPIIKLINAVLTQAIKQKASDIHFETFEDKFDVRFRIDGMLHSILQPPRTLSPLIISRLKIMSKLDIAEKRLPQDGRIALRIAGREVDVRVSSIPAYYGERLVLRILDKDAAPLDLSKLGMRDNALKLLKQLIAMPNGIILVTGPTGSGKTTTLYAVLTELNSTSRNIMTVEDPIEYYLKGISQTQVNTKIHMTFARALRAILRQDPDIIMVGEVRDLETAEMAVQASLTGHMVYSTLHTNSALGTVTRLQDMGVENYLIASTLVGMIAQRLVRVLCTHCKKARLATAQEMRVMEMADKKEVTVFEAEGCEECARTGYHGRVGIYEIVPMDESLRRLIQRNQSEADMEQLVREKYPSMRQYGWQCVLDGVTTISEVLRVTSEDLSE